MDSSCFLFTFASFSIQYQRLPNSFLTHDLLLSVHEANFSLDCLETLEIDDC